VVSDPGPAYLMLALGRLDRAGALARRLAQSEAPVAVHLAARIDAGALAGALARALAGALAGAPVIAIARQRTDWGGHARRRDAWRAGGANGVRARGVASGAVSNADLALRPPQDPHGFRAAHPGVDFIAAPNPQAQDRVSGGLSAERFNRRFPMSRRARPKPFDGPCAVCRHLGERRARPDVSPPLAPRLGAR
jgi:hypothetical protein